MKTFSQHLFRALLPGFLFVLLASGLLIKGLIARSLTSEFDRGLVSRAEALMVITEQDEDGVELEVYPDTLASYFQEVNPDYFEIRAASGQRLFKSASLDNTETLVATTQSTPSSSKSYTIEDVSLPDGRPGRQIQRSYFPKIDIDDDDVKQSLDGDQQVTGQSAPSAFAPAGVPVEKNGIVVVPEKVQLTVATSRSVLDAHLTQLNFILLLTGLLTTSAVVLLQRGAIRRAVYPIEDLGRQIQAININQVDLQLTVSQPIQELNALATRFNQLLQDLHEGFQRERRFSADLAHEMRTPLSELRSLVEVSQRWPSDQELKASFNNDVIVTVDRMERLTTNLLALSRGDLGLMQSSGFVNLTQLIPRTVTMFSKTVEAKGLTVSLDLPEHEVLAQGRDHWAPMLENLVENAAEYSPVETQISISCTVCITTGVCKLYLENEAPHISQEDLPRLFDRLWRKERARSSSRHSGLGLSLVKMYAQAAGGAVRAEQGGPGRIRFVVTGKLAHGES